MTKEARPRHKEDSAVDLLVLAGLPRNVAKALAFLSTRDETTSVDVEKATGLRQPEVSIAMQELRRRKWVEKRDVKKQGKGRPVHAYRLVLPYDEIVEAVARDAQRRIEEIEAVIRRLRRRGG